ncbi:apolipoprotein N-acyltransferase [Pseudoclavibacter endophyticus]|uniref:Apolipoprotein N-acyltransferase n=2 Tax=Pseudoclavibacter endophyticus TaxID=1778590 RepID=A0A6H9WVL6_9MICO|nr:apolipoprotein N-acyltransferase [Pseudoclavibacter endophyticus]
MSALAGFVLSWAFPAPGWWFLAPIGVAGMLLPLVGRTVRGALAVGFTGGLAFYGDLISWATLFLGPVPYGALTVLMAIWVAIGAALISSAYRWLPRRWPGRAGRLVALPIAVAGLWTLREAVASTWPYGGFAWGRVAQSQSASPFGDLVSWLGLSGLSFVLVALTALAVEWGLHAARWRSDAAPALAPIATTPRARRESRARSAASAAIAACAVALIAAVPTFPVTQTGTIRIGAVQGATPEAAYFIPNERRDVFDAHALATGLIALDADLDLLLWPEGSMSSSSPLFNPDVARELSILSARYGVPILANTVTVRPGESEGDDQYFNTQFVWDGSAPSAPGWTGQTVDKQHPIPFGEYIPDRDFWYPLAPDLIGLVQRGYTPGEGPAVLDVAGVRAGTFICYDIVDDGVIHDAVTAGSTVLLAPTNNADFGRTDELDQQLAFARLRAMETGRAIVQVSTVGNSAAYGPDGTELASLTQYVPGAMVVDVPLSETTTPAVAFGRAIEWLLAGAGLALLLGARGAAAMPRRRRSGNE